VAFTTVSDDKEEPKKSGKKKEIMCFICKKMGHYASECEEELPQKTPKKGSNMLILDEDSSVGSGQSKDYDYDDWTETAEAENYEHNNEPELQETEEAKDEGQVLDKQTDDDEEMESDEQKEEEAFSGQFEDEDYEGAVFVQDDVLCNMQHKAGIPDSWILLNSQSTIDVFWENVDQHS